MKFRIRKTGPTWVITHARDGHWVARDMRSLAEALDWLARRAA